MTSNLPFDTSVRPGTPTARLSSLRYAWHHARQLVTTIARAPLAAASYAGVNELWGLQELVAGRVYRSGEPRPGHFPRLHALGIRTLVCVKRTLPSDATIRFAREHGLAIARVDLGGDSAIELQAIARVLSVLRREDLGTILLHCDGGRHRTGMVAGALRCEQGWSLEATLAEYQAFAEPTPRHADRAVICRWFDEHERHRGLGPRIDWPIGTPLVQGMPVECCEIKKRLSQPVFPSP